MREKAADANTNANGDIQITEKINERLRHAKLYHIYQLIEKMVVTLENVPEKIREITNDIFYYIVELSDKYIENQDHLSKGLRAPLNSKYYELYLLAFLKIAIEKKMHEDLSFRIDNTFSILDFCYKDCKDARFKEEFDSIFAELCELTKTELKIDSVQCLSVNYRSWIAFKAVLRNQNSPEYQLMLISTQVYSTTLAILNAYLFSCSKHHNETYQDIVYACFACAYVKTNIRKLAGTEQGFHRIFSLLTDFYRTRQKGFIEYSSFYLLFLGVLRIANELFLEVYFIEQEKLLKSSSMSSHATLSASGIFSIDEFNKITVLKMNPWIKNMPANIIYLGVQTSIEVAQQCVDIIQEKNHNFSVLDLANQLENFIRLLNDFMKAQQICQGLVDYEQLQVIQFLKNTDQYKKSFLQDIKNIIQIYLFLKTIFHCHKDAEKKLNACCAELEQIKLDQSVYDRIYNVLVFTCMDPVLNTHKQIVSLLSHFQTEIVEVFNCIDIESYKRDESIILLEATNLVTGCEKILSDYDKNKICLKDALLNIKNLQINLIDKMRTNYKKLQKKHCLQLMVKLNIKNPTALDKETLMFIITKYFESQRLEKIFNVIEDFCNAKINFLQKNTDPLNFMTASI